MMPGLHTICYDFRDGRGDESAAISFWINVVVYLRYYILSGLYYAVEVWKFSRWWYDWCAFGG